MSDHFNNDAERQLGKFVAREMIKDLQKRVSEYLPRGQRISPKQAIEFPGKIEPIVEDTQRGFKYGYHMIEVSHDYGIYHVGDFIEIEATEIVETEE